MSIASEFNSYDQALSLIGEMPFADKLRFNTDLANLLRKEGKSGVVGKAAKKEKKTKDTSNKRTAGSGTLAWIAFVKHCKDTMPQRFTECKKEPERLAVVGAIKAEDKGGYDAFVVKFKDAHPTVLQVENSASPSEDESDDVPPPTPAPTTVPTLSAKEKLEKLKAVSASAALKKTEEKPKAEKPKAEKPKAEPKAKKEVKKAAPKAKAAEKPVEETPMPKKLIDGTDYWFDPETNGLYSIDNGGFGAWVGYFQPDNKETPIRHTESPSDE